MFVSEKFVFMETLLSSIDLVNRESDQLMLCEKRLFNMLSWFNSEVSIFVTIVENIWHLGNV